MPVQQVSSDLDFFRLMFPTTTMLGMFEIPQITLDNKSPPKVVVAKFYFPGWALSDALDEPFNRIALQYPNSNGHSDHGISQEKKSITFLNVNAQRLAELQRLFNWPRIPTFMIIRNGIILAQDRLSSEKQLQYFINQHLNPILDLPDDCQDPSALGHDYSKIEQFEHTDDEAQRKFDVGVYLVHSALHLVGSYVPDVETFPSGPVGKVAAALCGVVDSIFYFNNHLGDTSRFVIGESTPKPARIDNINQRLEAMREARRVRK